MPPAVMATPPWPGSSHGKPIADPTGENRISIEHRTVSGTDMHIQGGPVIYNKRLDYRRMHLVKRAQAGNPTITPFEWHKLIETIQG